MRKIIFIGECAAQFQFPAQSATMPLQVTVTPYGTMLNAACLCANAGMPTTYVSETARDFIGDTLISHMQSCGIDTKSIDRYADGGATSAYFGLNLPDGSHRSVIHTRLPEQDFDTVWPRIDPDDIVIFGSFFSLRDRSRHQILDLLAHARTRKALVIYLPGFPEQLAPRITRVMPAILENLELADIVLTATPDLQRIFGSSDPQETFRNHIEFSTPVAINMDFEQRQLSLFSRNTALDTQLTTSATDAGVLCALISACCSLDITSELIPVMPTAIANQILTATASHSSTVN